MSPDQGHPPPSYREIIRSTRLTLPDFFETTSSTQRTADRWLIKYRWPDGPRCPHCGSPDVEEERPQTAEAETRFRCGSCGRFTVRTHHFTAYPPVSFRHWLLAMYLMVSEPRFRSEAQIAHFLGLDHQTTTLVIHAIHLQMMVPYPLPLESVARVYEVDEACWPKHMDSADGERFAQRLYTVLVLDRASRQVRIWVVRDRATETMVPILARSGVGQDSTLNSDGLDVYKVAARFLLARHRWVNHTEYEYVSVDDPRRSHQRGGVLLRVDAPRPAPNRNLAGEPGALRGPGRIHVQPALRSRSRPYAGAGVARARVADARTDHGGAKPVRTPDSTRNTKAASRTLVGDRMSI